MSRENRARDPYDLPQEPELADLLRSVMRSLQLRIRTHVPASVIAYDPARQKATVEVATLQVVKVTDPARVPQRLLAIKGVPPNADATLQPHQLVDIPVAWPRTNLGYVTFPLAPGDTGELHVSDRSMELWMLGGIATDPTLAFLHALKDSVFHPGLHPDTNPIVPPTDMTATVVEGVAQIKLGRTATLSATLAEPLITALDAFANAIPVAQDGGAAIHTAFKSAWETAKPLVASVKVKVEP